MTRELSRLPEFLAPFFWDSDFDHLALKDHRDFVIRRVLQYGSWEAVTWLRAEIGDLELRQWIEQQHGAGLSPRQLRFWEIVLDLPHAQVSQWVHAAVAYSWGRRLSR